MAHPTLDMLATFVTLARTQSVAQTVKTLSITRQTVSRHIRVLEKHFDAELFVKQGHARIMSKLGDEIYELSGPLVDAVEAVLGSASAATDASAMLRSVKIANDDLVYLVEEHPLHSIWEARHRSLATVYEAWNSAKFQAFDASFSEAMKIAVVMQRKHDQWIFRHIGEDSLTAEWMGQGFAKDAIGKPAGLGMADKRYAAFYTRHFDSLADIGGAKLEHCYMQIAKGRGPVVPLSYQRLKLGIQLDDGSSAVGIFANKTPEISIDALELSDYPKMAR